jgi:hypothetical protein
MVGEDLGVLALFASGAELNARFTPKPSEKM